MHLNDGPKLVRVQLVVVGAALSINSAMKGQSHWHIALAIDTFSASTEHCVNALPSFISHLIKVNVSRTVTFCLNHHHKLWPKVSQVSLPSLLCHVIWNQSFPTFSKLKATAAEIPGLFCNFMMLALVTSWTGFLFSPTLVQSRAQRKSEKVTCWPWKSALEHTVALWESSYLLTKMGPDDPDNAGSSQWNDD